MRIINCFLIFYFLTCKISAQTTDTDSFIIKKKIIDSIVLSIDRNKELLKGIAEGNSKGEEGFDFNNVFYYYKNSKEIIKLEYNQYGDSETHIILYYKNLQLLLVDENKSPYYFVDNKFRNPDGSFLNSEKSNWLTEFEANTKKSMLDVLKRCGYKM